VASARQFLLRNAKHRTLLKRAGSFCRLFVKKRCGMMTVSNFAFG
jgi:hypothetical protein